MFGEGCVSLSFSANVFFYPLNEPCDGCGKKSCKNHLAVNGAFARRRLGYDTGFSENVFFIRRPIVRLATNEGAIPANEFQADLGNQSVD